MRVGENLKEGGREEERKAGRMRRERVDLTCFVRLACSSNDVATL